MAEKEKKKKKSLKRELTEMGMILGVFVILYATGLSTDVFGFLQRLTLETGLRNAGEGIPMEERDVASYQFSLVSTEGEPLNMADLKGKVVFMNVWATWCPPCVAEMPSIQNLYEEVSGQEDIVFLMVSVDEEQRKVQPFLERKDYTFPAYYPTSAFPSVYSSRSIPTTYVISPDGKIAYRQEGIANYDSQSFKDFLLGMVE